jgi:hypothetical protein
MNVIDARGKFADRARAEVKFPSYAPDMRYLLNLCAGICRSCKESSPVQDIFEAAPSETFEQLVAAVKRSVHGVEDVRLCPSSLGWRIEFDTRDDGNVFTYNLLIPSVWIKS